MKLLTKQLIDRFAKVGSQENVKDPIVICKFFNPCGASTWWITEYDPKENLFYGFANLGDPQNAEWGFVSMDELQNYKGQLGLGIERDKFFAEQPFSKVK